MSDTSINSTIGPATFRGTRQGGSWVVVISGEFDIACRECVRAVFAQAPEECDRVVVDARGVTFIDGGGLTALLTTAASWRGDVWLRAVSGPVRRVAEIAGLWEHWTKTISAGTVRIK